MSFWQDLPKPIIGLSPMDGVTDYPFRTIVTKYGPNCDLFFTEFIHVEALLKGKIGVYRSLLFNRSMSSSPCVQGETPSDSMAKGLENIGLNKPTVAQLFGSDPKYFRQATVIICALGFDGIDINMGCPARSVVKNDGGAALIKNPKLAQEIIQACKDGVKDWVNGKKIGDLGLDQEKIDYINSVETRFIASQKQPILISVKTRLGYDQNIISDWIKYLIQAKPDAITVHGRTFAQLYSGLADWNAIASVSDQVKKAGIIYLGNGDIKSYNQALEFSSRYNIDGVLIGRAALGNPWIFSDKVPDLDERCKVMFEHATYFDNLYEGKFFYAFRKHLGWYCKGFTGAKELRIKLIRSEKLEDLENIIKESKKIYE